MGAGEYFLRGDLEALRRDGSVTKSWPTAEEAARWRAGVRRVCRAEGLRVRTGASQDGTLAWALHVDHVVTAAETEAVNRAIEAALDEAPQPAPFPILVRHSTFAISPNSGSRGAGSVMERRPDRRPLRQAGRGTPGAGHG